MSESPSIKAADIRPGDTIQWNQTKDGIETTQKLAVAVVENLGAVVSLQTKERGEVVLSVDHEVALVDRPAPQLPTKPGSVIIAYEVRGVRNDDGWVLFVDEDGEWTGGLEVADHYWHQPGHITDWVPATVTKYAL